MLKRYLSQFLYSPILALSPSEMVALEELPEKDKDLIIPIIPLKGWSTSKLLLNSTNRIKKAIGNRKWIASLDENFLSGNGNFQLTGKYPREVFYEIEKLLDSKNGYENWCNYLADIPEAIPVLQIKDLNQIALQIKKLAELKRGIVVIFSINDIETGASAEIIELLSAITNTSFFIVYDIGSIDYRYMDYVHSVASHVKLSKEKIYNVLVAISASSFPSSFSGASNGENSIYERMLFEKIKGILPDAQFMYSDHGSARVEKQSGGGGIPRPRIDYPCKNDWRFIRKEFNDPHDIKENEKLDLYILIANEMVKKDYWQPELRLWGTQMIEMTALREKFSIDSPQKATAVRINIHLHNQLHYHSDLGIVDTDEDWVD